MIAAVVVVASLGAGIAYAQIPSSSGVISACYQKSGSHDKSGGNLRVIGDGTACKKGETKLTWNQRGQPGLNGTNGTNGKDGTNGKNGVSGYIKVEATKDYFRPFSPDPGDLDVSAFCPSGELPTGGGGLVQLYNAGGFARVGQIAESQGGTNSWEVGAVNPNDANITKMTVSVELYCITAS